MKNLSVMQQDVVELKDSATAVSPDSVDYWTNLIRSNINVAQTIDDDDSDDDASQTLVDEEIMNAPRRKSARDALANQIAHRLYPTDHPDSLASIIKYEKDIVMLRARVMEQRRSAINKASERNARFNWVKRIERQGPWDEVNDPLSRKGAPSLPMPVEVSDKESLAPFFAHLINGGTHERTDHNHSQAGVEPYYNTELIEFEKGVLYADGRVDLCKMVTGPRNIGDLMESLKTNEFSKHFLLGNNIIGPSGAEAIAEFINEYPERMETWYLAGNCIDQPSFATLVSSMAKSPVITNVWLKRNPLGPDAAADIYYLLTHCPNLRTLDLDQTELGDDGVADLFRRLTSASTPKLALQHIYLNAVGTSRKACKEIASYLASDHCLLTSLYMSNNPIGSAADVLADGLKANQTLERLSMQSCGLTDSGAIALLGALKGRKRLTMLDLGQAYATEDLGMRFNWLTDASAPAFAKLVQSTKLKYLNISYTPTTQKALCNVLQAVAESETMLWFHARPLVIGQKDPVSVHCGQEYSKLHKLARERLHKNVHEHFKDAEGNGIGYEQFESEHKRFLVSPKDVRLIDSVYRNRDAGAARRGLKKLDKWWDEGDETLRQVQDGTLV